MSRQTTADRDRLGLVETTIVNMASQLSVLRESASKVETNVQTLVFGLQTYMGDGTPATLRTLDTKPVIIVDDLPSKAKNPKKEPVCLVVEFT